MTVTTSATTEPTASAAPEPTTSAAPESTTSAAAEPTTSAAPESTANPATDSDPVQPEGFTSVVVRLTEVDGDTCEVCVWLADSRDERSQGLMGVTDLGDAAGMLFVYETPGVRTFHMSQAPTPLSIAWFAENGRYVDSTDMSPCLDLPSADCPRYAPDEPYLTALEVFAGGLDDLGIGPGARLEIIAPDCDRL